jgi:thioredoxin reductase (NADPH)
VLDCLIIGGGPAGLTAATYLARYRRSVAVYDAGHSRAALIPQSHNYPGFPSGVSGKELLRRLTRQAEFYNVPLKHAIISALERKEGGYRASYEGGEVIARRILLATGIVDVAPQIKGLDDAVEKGLVRYCPVCDAFEASDKRIAVLGGGDAAISKAKFLRDYSRDVTLLWQHGSALPDIKALKEAGIAIALPINGLEMSDQNIVALTGEGTRSFDVLYPALGCDVKSDLATRLGAETGEAGCLKVDEYQRTTVESIYAAGDVVSDLHQIAVGTGHAAVAATHIHKTLPAHPR